MIPSLTRLVVAALLAVSGLMLPNGAVVATNAQVANHRRLRLVFLAALVAVATIMLGTATASTATSSGAEIRARASPAATQNVDGVSDNISAGRRSGEVLAGPEIVVATGVAAKALGDQFRFGRVISTEAMAGWSMPGATLVYIFRTTCDALVAPNPHVTRPDNLLVAPVMTNRLPWSRGYFQTVDQRPLAAEDVLPQHCFRSSAGRYFDEHATELSGPVEPCGDWGLHSFRTIDDDVSGALGIARAPEDT